MARFANLRRSFVGFNGPEYDERASGGCARTLPDSTRPEPAGDGVVLLPATRKHVLNIRRIVGGTLVLVCLGVNVLAVVYVTREHKLIEETIAATTSDHGLAWAQLCRAGLRAGDNSELQRLMDAIGHSTGVRLAMVVSESGRVLAATDRSRIGREHRVEHDAVLGEGTPDDHRVEELHPEPTGFFHEEGHTFEFVFPIRNADQHLGTLMVHVNTAWGNQQAKALAMKGLALVMTLTAMVGLAAFALDRRLRRAVKALIAATQAIAKGERAPEVYVGTGDGLDILGDSVKQMAEALKDTEERVTHWHRELETTIADRTAQLEESQQLLAEREKMAALGLMAAGIVHEVGNPLAAMSAIVQRMGRTTDTRIAERCRTLHEQIERINRIVSDMRQVAGSTSSDGSSTNLNEIIGVAVKVARYDPRAKRIEILSDLTPDVPRIPGEPDRWQQVFLNLIINALEAMPHGGQLTIASSIDERQVEIVFRDSGLGMSVAQIRKVYHPFYTTKKHGGMGLGLSVCQSIVRSFGGDIEVHSEVDKGTEFRITVPFCRKGPETASSRTIGADDRGETTARPGSDANRMRG